MQVDQLDRRTARRAFLKAAAGTGAAALAGTSLAQSFAFTPNQRYPDPAVQILDPSFAKYRIYSSTVEQVATGMRWAEGPVYFPGAAAGDPGYLLVSDIPNNRIMKFDEKTGAFTVFRANANLKARPLGLAPDAAIRRAAPLDATSAPTARASQTRPS